MSRIERRQRREDKCTVREGANRGAGGISTVELHAMIAADGSAEAKAYVDRYIAAKRRLDAARASS